jgi:hypothetical protein
MAGWLWQRGNVAATPKAAPELVQTNEPTEEELDADKAWSKDEGDHDDARFTPTIHGKGFTPATLEKRSSSHDHGADAVFMPATRKRYSWQRCGK